MNVASFLADLGFRVAVTGILGSENAIAFARLFAQKGMTDGFVRIREGARVNVQIIDEAQQRITDINFPGLSASADDVAALRNRLAALIPDHEWFVLSGSVPWDPGRSLRRMGEHA